VLGVDLALGLLVLYATYFKGGLKMHNPPSCPFLPNASCCVWS